MTTTDASSELDRLLSAPSAKAVMRAFMRVTPSITAIVRLPDMKVLFVSGFASELVGKQASDLQSVPLETYEAAVRVFWPDGREVSGDERLLVRAARGETILGQEALVLNSRGELVPVLCNAAPIRSVTGELIGGIVSCLDVGGLKALEAELRSTYRELTHRVKNHLQLMSNLITLDTRDPDLSAGELAARNQSRLKMLAAVYNGMTQADAGDCIEALTFTDLVCRPYRSATVSVEVSVEPSDLTLAAEQAAPFGMLLNEAVCNSHKHAFPDRSGTVWVTLKLQASGELLFEVADDGIGMAPDRINNNSHGLVLMRMQAEKLKGSFELGPRPGGGTSMRSILPSGVHSDCR